MKTISFAVPCYNSAAYMDKCIESLLACDDGLGDVEILIVDDGSTKDDTAEKADEWHERYPEIIYAIHKENGGHGSAVNSGLEYCCRVGEDGLLALTLDTERVQNIVDKFVKFASDDSITADYINKGYSSYDLFAGKRNEQDNRPRC